MANNRVFESLNHDVVNFLTLKLNSNDLRNLLLVSKNVNTIFAKPVADRKKEKFIECVEKSNYTSTENILAHSDATLIFADNDRALLAACKTYDMDMLKVFLQAVQNSKDKKLVDKFYKKISQSIDHINLEPLLIAYDHYNKQCELAMQNSINEDDMKNELLQLGKKQAEFLPWWILKLYCHWQMDEGYSERSWDDYYITANYGKKRGEQELLNINKVGVDGALVNGMLVDHWGGISQKRTAKVLRYIFEKRKKEFAAFITQPELENVTIPKIKRNRGCTII